MPDTLRRRRDVMEEGNQPGRRRNRYPVEFRRDVACLVLDQGRSIADVAREMDLVAQTVGNWVRAEKIERGERDGLTREEREELARLRRENKRLIQERDLLKRATAFWVSESDR
jgi:transposase-like protein